MARARTARVFGCVARRCAELDRLDPRWGGRRLMLAVLAVIEANVDLRSCLPT
ncbi:MAG: hypothetical protein U0521_24055 [Anaerolineae bacterium]